MVRRAAAPIAGLVAGLTALAAANPVPQLIDLAGIEAAGPPPAVSVPIGASSTFVNYDATAVASDTAGPISQNPLPQINQRIASLGLGAALVKRTPANCAAQPAGYGPVPTEDTPSAFLAYSSFAAAATNALTPPGYVKTFTNLQASNNANGYMGNIALESYDPVACSKLCDAHNGCAAFNIYFERNPKLDPAENCPNPASTTVIKCVFWGGPVTADNANNEGVYREQFQVVIAGSNGYVNNTIDNVPGYSPPNYLGNVAINAPGDCNGADTYMGYKLFNDGLPFDSLRCAAACSAQSDYNLRHPPSDGSAPKLCKFFNTYILNKNGVPQGQYCSMYTESWANSHAVNTGQWRGDDHYTISYSYSFSNSTDKGVCEKLSTTTITITSTVTPPPSTITGSTTTDTFTEISTTTAMLPETSTATYYYNTPPPRKVKRQAEQTVVTPSATSVEFVTVTAPPDMACTTVYDEMASATVLSCAQDTDTAAATSAPAARILRARQAPVPTSTVTNYVTVTASAATVTITPTTTITTTTYTTDTAYAAVTTVSMCNSEYFSYYHNFGVDSASTDPSYDFARGNPMNKYTQLECCAVCYQTKDCALFYIGEYERCSMVIRRNMSGGGASDTCPNGNYRDIFIYGSPRGQVDGQVTIEPGPCLGGIQDK